MASEPPHDLTGVVARNIRALLEMRRREDQRRGWQLRFADGVTRFTGSMAFVWTHLAILAVWFVWNCRLIAGLKPFDPYPFVVLAVAASVEAIFLSTFVLITQNRMAHEAERRAELDLQISLLSEHEITRLVRLVDAIAHRTGVQDGTDAELEELKGDVAPERVLDEMDRLHEEEEHTHHHHPHPSKPPKPSKH